MCSPISVKSLSINKLSACLQSGTWEWDHLETYAERIDKTLNSRLKNDIQSLLPKLNNSSKQSPSIKPLVVTRTFSQFLKSRSTSRQNRFEELVSKFQKILEVVHRDMLLLYAVHLNYTPECFENFCPLFLSTLEN